MRYGGQFGVVGAGSRCWLSRNLAESQPEADSSSQTLRLDSHWQAVAAMASGGGGGGGGGDSPPGGCWGIRTWPASDGGTGSCESRGGMASSSASALNPQGRLFGTAPGRPARTQSEFRTALQAAAMGFPVAPAGSFSSHVPPAGRRPTGRDYAAGDEYRSTEAQAKFAPAWPPAHVHVISSQKQQGTMTRPLSQR